jgi:hypothetical protein
MSVPNKAKINQRLAKRGILFVVFLGVIAFGYWYLSQGNGDPDRFRAPYESAGQIAAIKSVDDGSQAVLIAADGKITPSPDYKAGSQDHNITWRGDGGRVIFESDRYQQQPHVFRWNPDADSIDRISIDKRGKGRLSFLAPGGTPSNSGLMIDGGMVVEINSVTGETAQKLPEKNKNAAQGGDEEGAKSEMEGDFSKYGTSFADARWGKDKKFFYCVMQGEKGQTLVIKDTTSTKPLMPVIAGDHIDIDVSQKTGELVFAVQGLQIPDWDEKGQAQYTHDGKITPPFTSVLESLNPETGDSTRIAMIKEDHPSFAMPRVSPDGGSILTAFGVYAKGQYTSAGIALMPNTESGADHPLKTMQVPTVSQLCWDPTGQQFLFIAKTSKTAADIFLSTPDFSTPKNITQGKGNFIEAVFSPRIKS